MCRRHRITSDKPTKNKRNTRDQTSLTVQSRYELLQNYNIHTIFLIYMLRTKPIDCDWRDYKLIQSDDPAKNYRYSILKSCREQYLVPFDGTNETTTHHTTTKKLKMQDTSEWSQWRDERGAVREIDRKASVKFDDVSCLNTAAAPKSWTV